MATARLQSLCTKISTRAALAVACFIGLGSGVTAYVIETSAVANAERTANGVAMQISGDVQSQFQRSIGTVEGMRNAIQSAHELGQINRQGADAILRSTLVRSPQLLATWSGWEPDAFDGKDVGHAGLPGHDQTGRYIPYWHREGDQVALSPLVDYTREGAGDYYLLPKRSGQPVLLEPYLYKVGDHDVLMTTIALPIMEAKGFAGVVGADIGLDDLKQRISAIKVPFGGRASVISGHNLYVYHPDSTMLGKNAGETTYRPRQVSVPGIGPVMQTEVRVRIDGVGASWTVRVELPMQAVLADTRTAELALLLSSLAMIVGLIIVLRVTASRLVGRPLDAIAETMGRLAAGDLGLGPHAPAASSEIARMQAAVEVFRANARDQQRLQAEQKQFEQEQTLVVDSLAECLQKLSEGNLRNRIDAPFSGRYADIKTNYNLALDKLEQLIIEVANSAQLLNSGAAEIRRASGDLSLRTEQQAASIEEAAAAMAQMTAQISDTASNAAQADKAINDARQEAAVGGATVQQATHAMEEIRKASDQISEIISVINSITFQTNLLALNAGVEAARAGSAGQGFAVVAAEVRALAQRCSDAANDIKAQIDGSTRRVADGVRLVADTGRKLETIIERISDVSDLASQIARSAGTQSARIQEINATVMEMDVSTQRNSAMVDQSTTLAGSLADRAAHLTALIGHFSFSNQNGALQASREAALRAA